MSKSSMLFQSVWVSAAFLWRPVGGSRPHARDAQWFGSSTWSKSERREIRFLPSTPIPTPSRAFQRTGHKRRFAPFAFVR